MAPKRRAAPKAKTVVESETLPDMSHITVRQNLKNEVIKKTQEDEELESVENFNSTVVIEKMNDFPNSAENIESEKSNIKLIDEEPKKIVKKTAVKGKSKILKDEKEEVMILRGRTRASSVDRKPIYTALEKKPTGKSKKRPIDKDVSPNVSDSTKPTVLIKATKRNRRAGSVDILSTEISKTSEGTIVVTKDTQQLNKKKLVREIPVQDLFNTKLKKNIKKNDVKEPLLTQEISADSPDIPQATKPKRNAKKDQIDKPEDSEEPSTKKISKARKVTKIKQIDEIEKDSIIKKQKLKSPSEENNSSDDCILVSPEQNYTEPITKKSAKNRRPQKVKQIEEIDKESIIKKETSPPKEVSVKNNDSDDCDLVLETPEIKPKRGAKKGKTNGEQKVAEDNKPKISKRGRKIKGDILEEPLNFSPPSDNNREEVNDETAPDTPESDKTDVKPLVKRKNKAKLAKK